MPLARAIMDAVAPEPDPWGLMAFERSRRAWSAGRPQWVRVPGGRAVHAMVDGDPAPVCGVVPVRADGTVSPWRSPGYGGWSGRRHKRCQDLAARRWVAP